MAGRQGRRGFGWVRRLPSKRHQASYIGPDDARHYAPETFTAKEDAEAWLAAERRLIESGGWTAPDIRLAATAPVTFGPYADAWLAGRTLKPRTRAHYRKLLDHQIAPTFTAVPVHLIRPELVRRWHAELDADKPTTRAHAYGLLRTILATAVGDEILATNPCHIRGAGAVKRRHQPRPASLEELATLVEAMPERYRLMVELAAWCALRFGELTELRRSDFDLKRHTVRVSRGVVRADNKVIVGDPKSDAGRRDVAIPPHLMPSVREHLRAHAAFGKDGLVFPAAHGGHMAPSALYKVFYRAREKAGRPDLRFHDLRHTGAVLAASTGATLAELMARLGHSTAGAAMRYQHVAGERDTQIAAALSALVDASQSPSD